MGQSARAPRRAGFFTPGLSIGLVALATLFLQGCDKATPVASTPVDFNIACSAGLSPAECDVERRFAGKISRDVDGVVALYRAHFGNEINVDNAREFSDDYAPDGIEGKSEKARKARTRWTGAVQRPSALLSMEVYRRMLAADTIVFTAGGAGSGKTTAIRSSPAITKRVANAFAVYDTTLSDEVTSLSRVEQALKSGKKVHTVFVYRDPLESWANGALPRAMQNGRIVPLRAFAAGHLGAPAAFEAIRRTYANDNRLSYEVIDNDYGPGHQRQVTDIGKFFAERAQKPDELRAKLEAALESAFRNGKISRDVYEASR